MSAHLLVAFTNPADGQLPECTSWYRDVHLAEALSTPGYETARLLTRTEDQLPKRATPPSDYHFLAVYDISVTPAELVRTTGRYLASGYTPPSCLARGGGGPWIFTQIGNQLGSGRRGEHLIVALTEPVAGMDDEFNDWYGSTHLVEALSIPGFESARRFRLDDIQMSTKVASACPQRYLTLYEVSGSTTVALNGLLSADFTPCEAVYQAMTRTWSYTSIAYRDTIADAA